MSFTGNMPATLFWECLLRIFLAALCGLVIGFERKARLKEAGVRTHLIVALGAALITIVSKYGFFDLALFAEGIKADPTRIAAQIVSGVGFLGAGMIFMRHRTLTGLTTAAGIWTTAGIGMAVGCGLYAVSLFSTALVVLTQLMLHRDYRWTRAPGCTAVCLRTQPGPSGLRQALAALDEMQVQVINLEASHKRSGLSPIAYRSKRLPAPTARKVTPAAIHERLPKSIPGKVKSSSART